MANNSSNNLVEFGVRLGLGILLFISLHICISAFYPGAGAHFGSCAKAVFSVWMPIPVFPDSSSMGILPIPEQTQLQFFLIVSVTISLMLLKIKLIN